MKSWLGESSFESYGPDHPKGIGGPFKK